MIFRFIKSFCCKRHFSQSRRQVRVRFAPSPTGHLHLGGLRTALYNYLFAKSRHGRFLLRIEDTDQSRLVKGAAEQLRRDLQWAGIQIDEGPYSGGQHGPYVQSERLEIYKDHVKILLENKSAYHCFCSDKRLELLRKEAVRAREVPKYDNRCRGLPPEEVLQRLSRGDKSCIRFKLTEGATTFQDLIFGAVTYDIAANEGDPVIVKSDGFPTYHFANVVDDHSMEISHVLRGVEWQISTTKHILMYRAFNWEPPLFGHLPLLMNPDGTKLSKRQGDIQISNYRDSGIFPLALINFIVNSGGGFGKDSERHLKPRCYTIEELSEQFDISRVNSHSGRLMPERLSEFNRLELKRRLSDSGEEKILICQVQELVSQNFPEESLDVSFEHVKHILKWSLDRITKLSDLVADDLKFIWICPKTRKIESQEAEFIEKLKHNLDKRDADLSRDRINGFLKTFCDENQIQFSKFMKLLRSVLSGLKQGPSVAEMIEILGKEVTVRRLESCLGEKNKSLR